MAFKDKETKRNYMRNYYKKRKLLCIEKLGGKCAVCGNTENLQFDHIDRKSKIFAITNFLNYSKESLKHELEKCQLLCVGCHKNKTKMNKEYTINRKRKLNEDQISEIFEKILEGKRLLEIAKEYGVSRPAISHLKKKLLESKMIHKSL